jgi:hypothetical protein
MGDDAADAIERSGSAMPRNYIDFIYIYKANNKGFPGADGNTTMAGCPGSACVKYTWNDSLGRFSDDTTGTWPATSINACQGDPQAQAVGIYLEATHPTITRLFATQWKVRGRAVLKFEPMSTTTPGVPCKP